MYNQRVPKHGVSYAAVASTSGTPGTNLSIKPPLKEEIPSRKRPYQDREPAEEVAPKRVSTTVVCESPRTGRRYPAVVELENRNKAFDCSGSENEDSDKYQKELRESIKVPGRRSKSGSRRSNEKK